MLSNYAAGRDLRSRQILTDGMGASLGFVLWLLDCENCYFTKDLLIVSD